MSNNKSEASVAQSVRALLQAGRAELGQKFSAALDARLLLQAAAGLTHAELAAEPDRVLPAEEAARFHFFLARRLAHEPVSRILGRREFYGRNFTVTPDVLDPRADTETLVTLALEHCPNSTRFLDLGTGTGAIAITLCAERETFSGIAVDISAAALKVARTNAETLGVSGRIHFQQGSWYQDLSETFDLIISNPPYIREDAELMPDVRLYDPSLALFGGADGLAAYRAIAAGAGRHLAPGGRVIVEIGQGQAAEVAGLFSAYGFRLVQQALDLAEIPRALHFEAN